MFIATGGSEMLFLSLCIFTVAILYSSVGHGGASGYLAVMSFFAFAPDEMATTALILNIIVASFSFYFFYQEGYFNWKITWPFLITSIPFAFLGGLLKIPTQVYYLLLAIILFFASWHLVQKKDNSDETVETPPTEYFLLSGAGIGLLSGIIGIGGGIFLSPLMILMRWAKAKPVAATSALFIVVNANAGLWGRYFRDGLDFGNILPLIIAALSGALVGSQLGSRRYSSGTLKKVLSAVLILAGVKLILHAGLFSF